jgi:hypothetical protein
MTPEQRLQVLARLRKWRSNPENAEKERTRDRVRKAEKRSALRTKENEDEKSSNAARQKAHRTRIHNAEIASLEKDYNRCSKSKMRGLKVPWEWIPISVLWRDWFKKRCFFCGKKVSFKDCQWHHETHLEHRGLHYGFNLVPAHRTCHGAHHGAQYGLIAQSWKSFIEDIPIEEYWQILRDCDKEFGELCGRGSPEYEELTEVRKRLIFCFECGLLKGGFDKNQINEFHIRICERLEGSPLMALDDLQQECLGMKVKISQEPSGEGVYEDG